MIVIVAILLTHVLKIRRAQSGGIHNASVMGYTRSMRSLSLTECLKRLPATIDLVLFCLDNLVISCSG